MTSNGGQTTAPRSTRAGSNRNPRNGRTSAMRPRAPTRARPPAAGGAAGSGRTGGTRGAGVYQRPAPPAVPADWGAIARIYDLEPPACRGAELAFWHRLAAAGGGATLELASGSGRVAMALARKGHHVTGLELSERMLARARARTARLPDAVRARLRWIQGDMAAFELPGQRFTLVFVAYNSFWLLTDPARQAACLRCAARHLAVGGRLALDLFPPNAF